MPGETSRAGAELPSRRPSLRWDWLRHPVTLLLLGAFISSFLVPWYSTQSQNHERALQIRGDLAKSISGAVSPFLAATLGNEFDWRNGKPPRTYDSAYQTWTTNSSVILSQLRTYFPKSILADKWQTLTDNVQWLYYLFKVGVTPYASRMVILRGIIGPYLNEYTSCKAAGVPCLRISRGDIAQFHVPPRGINPALDLSLRNLLAGYRLKAEAITQQILSSKPRL